MAWVCDYCYGVMEESRAGKNRKKAQVASDEEE